MYLFQAIAFKGNKNEIIVLYAFHPLHNGNNKIKGGYKNLSYRYWKYVILLCRKLSQIFWLKGKKGTF